MRTLFKLTLRGWLISLILLFHNNAGGSAPAPPPAPFSTQTRLTLEWRLPNLHIASNADGTTRVIVSGYMQTHQPGAAQLPFTSDLIAVPEGNPDLEILLDQEITSPLPGPLAIAPFPEGVQRDERGLPIGGAFVAAPRAVTTTGQAGSSSIIFEPLGVVRGVRLGRLTFYPVRVNPDGQTLSITNHLRVSIAFPAPQSRAPSPDPSNIPGVQRDPLLATIRSTVVNPSHIQSPISNLQTPPSNLQSSSTLLAIQVYTPGLTALTYDTLSSVGLADPRTLHLERGGQEIAAEWDGDEDASFEPGERLLFYAAPRFSRWTPTDVYFLRQDTAPALRMQNRSAAPSGLAPGVAWAEETREINALYTPDCFCGKLPPGRDGDRWVWDDLKRPGQATNSYPTSLPGVDTTQPATLTAWFIGYTDVAAAPDHRVDVLLNNIALGHTEWNGKQAITITLPITPGLLCSAANTLTFALPDLPGVSIQGVWLDAFSIRYARGSTPVGQSASLTGQPTPHAYTLALSSTTGLRAYDVTAPNYPVRLTGLITNGNILSLSDPLTGPHRYAVATESAILAPVEMHWTTPLQVSGADYVMIASQEFIPALDRLVALRQSQGLKVAIEDVQAIYDAYGGGRPDPRAIYAYLAHAYAAWTPHPTYVLLVGDGSFDPRRYRADSPPTFIPPYLADIDPWAGEAAADNRYVTVDGDDALPDMLIGRLPVKTLTETHAIVGKIVQYETSPLPGGWNGNVTFVADDADPAGDFAAESESIAAAWVAAPFTPQRIYFTPPTATITATQRAVLNRWDAGALIVQFLGHSSWQQWAQERLFHLDDLPTLNNHRRWPIVVEMTCFTGAFQRPEPTLDEVMMTLNRKGAVATWGATGLGVSTGHNVLANGFFRSVFSDTHSTVGQAALSGKLSLAATGQHVDLLDTFTLLGDPALRLNQTIIPWTNYVYLPILTQNANQAHTTQWLLGSAK